MFSTIDQKPGLAHRLYEAGIIITTNYSENNPPEVFTNNDAAAQTIIESWTLADSVNFIVVQIKEHARSRILAYYPEWRQTNMVARATELVSISTVGTLSVEEVSELNSLRSAWAWIKSVRNVSNVHESNLRALVSYEDIAAYNWYTNWPE